MPEKVVLLDASAVLAWLQEEPGHEVVDPLLPQSMITSTNWSEVLQKIQQAGRDSERAGELLLALGLTVIPVLPEDAVAIARWWSVKRHLSVGDRTCLAVGQRLRARIVTAEKAWENLPDVEILLIR
jgi:PIN domain nuclease of toxin-antitoxin system